MCLSHTKIQKRLIPCERFAVWLLGKGHWPRSKPTTAKSTRLLMCKVRTFCKSRQNLAKVRPTNKKKDNTHSFLTSLHLSPRPTRSYPCRCQRQHLYDGSSYDLRLPNSQRQINPFFALSVMELTTYWQTFHHHTMRPQSVFFGKQAPWSLARPIWTNLEWGKTVLHKIDSNLYADNIGMIAQQIFLAILDLSIILKILPV